MWWLESISGENQCWSQSVDILDIFWASSISTKGRAVSSLGSCQAFQGVCLWARILSEIVKHLLWNPVEESDHRTTAGRRKRSYLFPFCPLMCLLITALMKYLQLIMIWSNWNPFRKDKWNCYYWWMLCDSGGTGMAVWASDGSYYIGWIISVIAAFWFVMPESCLIGLCKELDLSAVTAQTLLVVHPLLNLVSILSNSPPGIPCLSHGRLSAGRASGPCWISLGAVVHPLLCTQPCLHRDCSALRSLIWHFHFTDITTCLHWPKMPTWALAKRQLSSVLAASACFPFQKQSGAYDPDSEKDLFHLTFVIQTFGRKGEERMWSLKKISLEDVSGSSLASKELGSPGWPNHPPWSQITAFF